MKKADLKSRVAKATGVEHHVVGVVVDAIFNELKNGFVTGEKMEFRGFGTFTQRHTASKVGRVIATGESINIPARNTVKFKVSKEILNEMNK
jgi:nucleoid DNA-binding protein